MEKISNTNDIAIYFADPGTPSQRGLNEHSNGLLRKDGLPKERDFNQKVTGRNRPTWKEPKTGWIKEKDDTNHAGKKWKIKDKQGNRKVSVDGNGKIILK